MVDRPSSAHKEYRQVLLLKSSTEVHDYTNTTLDQNGAEISLSKKEECVLK